MVERNLCKEAGCAAACCGDFWPKVGKDVKSYFPKAQEIPYEDLHERLPDGTYFSVREDVYWVRIVGPCENLLPDSNCSIYENRPSDCKNLQIRSDECFSARIEQAQFIALEAIK